MRVVPLSDHPGAMLKDAQRRRAAADRDRQLALEQARAQHRWGGWLRGILARWRAGRPARASRVAASQPTDEEARLAAGAAGERLVAEELGRMLDGQWTLLRGYRNRRGEIDHVLLGPRACSRSR